MNQQMPMVTHKMAVVESWALESEHASRAQVNCCTPAPLLFSLQFYVDRVSHLSPSRASHTDEYDVDVTLLLGFQLLQYEIVIFDKPLEAAEEDDVSVRQDKVDRACDGQIMRVQHGKSCLFEADPAEFARELQHDREAPLALLLMVQENGRARLRAFAGVPLELHVGLQLDSESDTLNASMQHRVCEWASQSGVWELHDHRGRVMGSVVGTVTLSCLGRTLAPHLTSALGVQVSRSQPSSASNSRVQSPMGSDTTTTGRSKRQSDAVEEDSTKSQGREAQRPAGPQQETVTAEQRVQAETLESGVQCNEEEILLSAASATNVAFASLSLRHGDSGIRLDRTKAHNRDSGLRGKRQHKTVSGGLKGRALARQDKQAKEGSCSGQVHSILSDELLLPRELPPPLFFQKAVRKKS